MKPGAREKLWRQRWREGCDWVDRRWAGGVAAMLIHGGSESASLGARVVTCPEGDRNDKAVARSVRQGPRTECPAARPIARRYLTVDGGQSSGSNVFVHSNEPRKK